MENHGEFRLIADFFETDAKVKRDIPNIFLQRGEMTFEDFSNDIIRYLTRRLELNDYQIDQIRSDKRMIIKIFMKNYEECVEMYCNEFNKIKITPEELTGDNYTITDQTSYNAINYLKKLSVALYELENPDTVKTFSNSSFSRFSIKTLDRLREYIGENFGEQYVRRFEYICESDLKDEFDSMLKMVLATVEKQASNSCEDLLSIARRMQPVEEKSEHKSRAAALLD